MRRPPRPVAAGGCRPADGAAIEVVDLHKRYGHRAVLDGVDLQVASGEVFGILGANGAGKTTLMETIAGIRTADAGAVRVLGLDPVCDRAALRQRVGVQLQETQLPERITVQEALELFASFYPEPASCQELLEAWQLGACADTRFGALSGGQRQRLGIALAFAGRPRLVLLDELTTGLDPRSRRQTWELVRQLHGAVTVVLISHLMDEVEQLCDRVALLDGGVVRSTGTPRELIDAVGGRSLDDVFLALAPDEEPPA